jgi:hypothetical protein
MNTRQPFDASYPVYAAQPLTGLPPVIRSRPLGGRFIPFVLPLIGTLAISVLLGAAASTAPKFDEAGYGVRPIHVSSCEGDNLGSEGTCKIPVV